MVIMGCPVCVQRTPAPSLPVANPCYLHPSALDSHLLDAHAHCPALVCMCICLQPERLEDEGPAPPWVPTFPSPSSHPTIKHPLCTASPAAVLALGVWHMVHSIAQLGPQAAPDFLGVAPERADTATQGARMLMNQVGAGAAG
jgi:hypothetical protein